MDAVNLVRIALLLMENLLEDNDTIKEGEVPPAHVHDSQVFGEALQDVKQRHSAYADNAYANAEKEERLDKERGIYCLTSQRGADWKWWNTIVARTRSRVEHVFGWMEKAMGGKNQKTIGLRRNRMGPIASEGEQRGGATVCPGARGNERGSF